MGVEAETNDDLAVMGQILELVNVCAVGEQDEFSIVGVLCWVPEKRDKPSGDTRISVVEEAIGAIYSQP